MAEDRFSIRGFFPTRRCVALAALVMGLMVGCTLGSGASSRSLLGVGSPRATTSGFEVSKFTSQVQFPGVESNLQSTKVYRLTLSGTFPEGAQRFALWVDSVSIPVRLIQDQTGIAMDMAPGRRIDIRFSANRQNYRQGTSGSGRQLPVETYPLTGVNIPHNHGWLTFQDRWGQVTHWDLGIPEVLPPLYAP
ncbi:MAG: hypothetical protein O3B70_08390 [Bacteroidetes bacterium]|nr:hypothetical protein [Bacteroidota bacterium]MDA0904341.1 hypothetical protein [Bacteroidota bacterium]MDA1243110.1 hypothetical protein [Bacteroidota bacterium]